MKNLLRGSSILLRSPEPSDIDLIFRMENDPGIWHFGNTLMPFSRYQIEQYVLNTQHDIFSEKQIRLMIEKTDPACGRQIVGTIDLFDFDPQHRRAGIGILIEKEERRKGYAAEALNLLIDYGFHLLGLHQLYCSITADNAASMELFEKAGFVRCEVKRDWRLYRNEWVDETTFQLINK